MNQVCLLFVAITFFTFPTGRFLFTLAGSAETESRNVDEWIPPDPLLDSSFPTCGILGVECGVVDLEEREQCEDRLCIGFRRALFRLLLLVEDDLVIGHFDPQADLSKSGSIHSPQPLCSLKLSPVLSPGLKSGKSELKEELVSGQSNSAKIRNVSSKSDSSRLAPIVSSGSNLNGRDGVQTCFEYLGNSALLHRIELFNSFLCPAGGCVSSIQDSAKKDSSVVEGNAKGGGSAAKKISKKAKK